MPREHPADYLCIDGHGREMPEQEHGDVTVITPAYSGRRVGGGRKGDRKIELTKAVRPQRLFGAQPCVVCALLTLAPSIYQTEDVDN